jgi:hypothetical protein
MPSLGEGGMKAVQSEINATDREGFQQVSNVHRSRQGRRAQP